MTQDHLKFSRQCRWKARSGPKHDAWRSVTEQSKVFVSFTKQVCRAPELDQDHGMVRGGFKTVQDFYVYSPHTMIHV